MDDSKANANLVVAVVNMLTKSVARYTVLFFAFSFLSCLLLYRVADSLCFQLPLSASLSVFPSIFPSSLFDASDDYLPSSFLGLL
ncbi:hypothetical protein ACOSP7_029093 [Xanthoceras sorbifolium]